MHNHGNPIEPVRCIPNASVADLIENFGRTCFEARNIADGAKLLEKMINEGDTIWLGVAGAGPAGGLGGYIIDLIEKGFIDAICSTGAQVYHDGHFAFGLPVVQGNPHVDDNALRKSGDVRIYDIRIRENETLIAQDELFREFIRNLVNSGNLPKVRSTADYNHYWGKWVNENAPHPEKSWVAAATKYNVPIFLDSESNHSIGMNNAAIYLETGIDVSLNASLSLLQGAAILYTNPQTSFFELGGGGPKNWIQTLAPMLSQILGKEFKGAKRGIQITTAPEFDGGLSGCTFSEAVSWGKYEKANEGLVQIHAEYSAVFPILAQYVFNSCKERKHSEIYTRIPKTLFDLRSLLV